MMNNSLYLIKKIIKSRKISRVIIIYPFFRFHTMIQEKYQE